MGLGLELKLGFYGVEGVVLGVAKVVGLWWW